MTRLFITSALVLSALVLPQMISAASDTLEQGFENPPREARLRAYWWWLNGNVTKEAITKDLEWMKSIGMGGGLIFDAGGGAGPTPTGPLYGSPEWRELFKHTLKEADRLGLELTLSAQSGWNLGGPAVKPEESSKHITWSEIEVVGPTNLSVTLPVPKSKGGFYADSYVLAYRQKATASSAQAGPEVKASSAQRGSKAEAVLDNDRDTFWVSKGQAPGEGPTRERPEWLQFDFTKPVSLSGIKVTGRSGYGPADCEWQVSADGKKFTSIKAFKGTVRQDTTVLFPEIKAPHFRLKVSSSYDTKGSQASRNVQVCEIAFLDKAGQEIDFHSGAAPIRQLRAKCIFNELGGSAPDCSGLLDDIPGTPGEEDVKAAEIMDLSAKMDKAGTLTWTVPEGVWQVLRFGYTINGGRVSTSSGNWKGLVVDYLDAAALRTYWRQVVEPLIADAGPLAGKVLKGFQTDSWEGGGINWTAELPSEFLNRRGYSLTPYLPVIAGRIVESREISTRFLNDFRKTIADCMADNHYGVMSELAAKNNMYIHCEASGPHAGPFDGLKNLGRCGAPMGEFWVPSPHRGTEDSRFFTKVASSAAHTYGKRIACAEGFTSVGPHWNDVLWSSQKPTFDHEACAGMNLVYWHAFTCSPEAMGMPGQEYFAGTHFNPQITWARQAHAFVGYLNRCQFLLQQGDFVADVCVYSGDHVPNIPGRKQQDPAGILPGYDYDVFNEEVLLTRMSVKDGRIILPAHSSTVGLVYGTGGSGISYKVMAFPNLKYMSLNALTKIYQLVKDGAVIVGPKPERTSELTGYPVCDTELKKMADELWGAGWTPDQTVDRKVGKGRVVSGKPVTDVLASEQLMPDFECHVKAVTWPLIDKETRHANMDYIHRRDGTSDWYFISNQRPEAVQTEVTLRVDGKQPELWDPVTATRREAVSFRQEKGRTTLPLAFEPYGSVFVVFRNQKAEVGRQRSAKNWSEVKPVQELAGPWTVNFDPKWGGPEQPVTFDTLQDWSKRAEDGIRYYSGTATYCKTFDCPTSGLRPPTSLFLDLGLVKEMATVRLNGKDLGVVWCPPWRVDVTDVVKPAGNVLEIDVVNYWPNRLIGDSKLPPDKRLTKTNCSKWYTPPKSGGEWPLFESGLLGPVTLQRTE